MKRVMTLPFASRSRKVKQYLLYSQKGRGCGSSRQRPLTGWAKGSRCLTRAANSLSTTLQPSQLQRTSSSQLAAICDTAAGPTKSRSSISSSLQATQ
jgi:hypothetical protein